ncbi:YadA-like family protein [Megasphaera sp.]|uniref:YadA-like family protein n=1 Tax=Megasphaera sp. TaxID=2023260 RepID=UPI0035223619
MRTSKSSTAWKKRAALLLTVTALCTASSPFTSFAADPVTASEVNISVKGGTRGLTASGITPGHVYADASSWKEGAAGATNSVAIGGGQVGSMSSSASVRGQNSVAVGAGASIDVSSSQDAFNSANATAIGTLSSVSAMQGTAVGYKSKVTGAQGTAIGEQSTAEAAGAATFGEGSHAKAEKSTALGTGANVGDGANNSVALGAGSTVFNSDLTSTDKNGVVSLGSGNAERRIIHVADGVKNTDAATVGQLNKAVDNATKNVNDVTMNTTDALNGSTETRSFKAAGLVPGKSNSNYSTAIGNTGFGDPSIGTNSDMSVAIGDVSQVGDNAERSTAIGYNSNIAAEAEHSVAIGESSSVSKKESVAVGKDAQVETQNAIAIGTGARIGVGAVNSVAIGGQYEYDEEDGLGGGSDYLVADNAKNSTVIGAAALSQSEGGTALGEGARVAEDANDSVALGHGSYVGSEDLVASDKNGVVSVGTSADSDGNVVTRRIINVSDGVKDSDAATLGQLNKAMQNKTYTADSTLQHDIDTMKAGINSNAQKVGTGKLTNGAEDLTQGVNANTASIQKNSSAIQQNTTAINENSNAIQRNATAIQQNTDSITSLNTHVRSLDQEVDSVGALSAALAGLHPIDYDGTGSRFQISAAAGTYDGKQAVALGGFYHANRDVMFSLGASSTFGNNRKAAGNIGVTFRVGPSANKTVDNNQNNDDIEMLKAEIQELKAEIRNLKSK